jgi:MFS transporter, UMF1 family
VQQFRVNSRELKGTNMNKKIQNGWAMYDWANSAFATSILTTLLPVYYQSVAGKGLPAQTITAYWGYTTSIALLITAIISPIYGTLADIGGKKKFFLRRFAMVGILGTALLFFVGEGDWLKASIFFIIANIGYAGANVFYDALLPHIAAQDEMEKISARGLGLGYLGGGLLLALQVGFLLMLGEEYQNLIFRWAFLSVAGWWWIFSRPIFKHMPEPAQKLVENPSQQSDIKATFQQLAITFRDIKKQKQVFLFLIAVWLFMDGIGTIVKMAVIVGAEIGITQEILIATILAIQFISIPFAFLFGWLAGKIGTKNGIFLGLTIFLIASILAMRMSTNLDFMVVGFLVATAQGGTQALTRALGAKMIPKARSGEFFGFVSVMIKFAGVAGPALFGLVAQNLGNSRLGFGVVIFFFVAGMLVLSKVDEEEAIRVAELG